MYNAAGGPEEYSSTLRDAEGYATAAAVLYLANHVENPAAALQELAAMSENERSELAPLIPLSQLCQEVVALIENETATGRVVVLWRGQPARTLDPGLRKALEQNELGSQQ